MDKLKTQQEQDSDYDGAWKEAIREHFPAFIQVYFEGLYGLIDWSVEPEWCDKELSQVIGMPGERNKSVDLLVRITLLDGTRQRLLLHLEVQSSYEDGFAYRLSRLNSGLFWTLRQRVITAAVLADLRAGWIPDKDVFQVGEFKTFTSFPMCKLIDRIDTDWKSDNSLPVQLARAQIAALRTAGDPEGRYLAKWQLIRNLYDLGYSANEVRELFRLIDWMMHLRSDLEERLMNEVTELEEELDMPYVTYIERTAEERGRKLGHDVGRQEGWRDGRQEGWREGASSLILEILAMQHGELPAQVKRTITELESESLQQLDRDRTRMNSLADIQDWLANH